MARQEARAMIISAPTDFRRAAQRRLPPFLFHYIDGDRARKPPCAATRPISSN
jgi:L-lactate dehydrogenase (cytochrome)